MPEMKATSQQSSSVAAKEKTSSAEKFTTIRAEQL
jgi:hypothetical protein